MVINEFVEAKIAFQVASAAGRRRSFWDTLLIQFVRMRFQLAGGFLLAVALPGFVANRMSIESAIDFGDPTFVGTLWAFLLGYMALRKVTAYPGVRATAFILPSFFGAYAVVAAVILLMRLEYSTVQFSLSLGASVVFFYVIFFLARLTKKTELAIVPVGDFQRLFGLEQVSWQIIPEPEASRGSAPIVVDLRADLSPEWERFVTDTALAGRPVYNAKQVFESLSGRVLIEHLSENTFGSLTPSSIYASAKRHCDGFLALVALVLLLPVLLLIGLLIRIDSEGPALFRQQRTGLGGRPFTVYKYRTMRTTQAAPDAQSEVTVQNDPRITRFGRFLRKVRIDELPQILNVLRGEMSWIGPRPEAVNLSAVYAAELPFYRYRHLVRPGITGWAQVHQGHVTSLEDTEVKLQYDFFYVKHFSLWLDILVVLKTIRVVFTGDGAR
jgi:lipopolysaccharide/colanic/teichoic acid biosynthesis glycosyltransferase